MSTTETNGTLGALRGIPPADPGKFLKSSISGPLWDRITADDIEGLSTTVFQSWRWTTSKTDASSTGRLGVNADTWQAVTQININENTNTGVDWSNIFNNAHDGDNLVIQDSDDATNVGRFHLIGDPVDNGTWRSFPVEFDSGSGTLPKNNTDVRIAFTFYTGGGGPGGGGGSIDYIGAYNPLTTYNDGDIVIGDDGIAYICVQNGTVGIPPSAWSGSFQIAQSDLPLNLQAGAADPTVLDCNLFTATGWYWINNSVVNAPYPNFNGFIQNYVAAWNSGYRNQISYSYADSTVWRRSCNGGVWTAWATDTAVQLPAIAFAGTLNQTFTPNALTGVTMNAMATNIRGSMYQAQLNPCQVILNKAGWYSFSVNALWNNGSVDAGSKIWYLQGALFPGGAAVRPGAGTNYGREGFSFTEFQSNDTPTAVSLSINNQGSASDYLSTVHFNVVYQGALA